MPKSYEEKYEEPEELSTIFTNRLNDLKSEIKVQLPCRITSVNHDGNQVSVEILDYDTDSNGKLVNYPIIPNVPIRQPMDSSDAFIRLPAQVGDVGTIEFFDSSVSDVVTNDSYNFDTSEEWHSLNNGLFTNGFLPKGKLFTFDTNSKIVIGTKSGEFTLKVNANDELVIEAPKVSITGDVEINGDVNVDGAIVSTGEITGNNIPLSTHKHSGVTTGSGTTGGPTT